MFPDQEPGGRGPPSKHLVQILRGVSSSCGFLIREHSKQETPPGGGGSFDQLLHAYTIITLIVPATAFRVIRDMTHLHTHIIITLMVPATASNSSVT